MSSQAILVTILMLLATGRYSEPMPMPTCATSCGNLTMPPYSYGMGSDCNLDVSVFTTPKTFSYLQFGFRLNMLRDERMIEASMERRRGERRRMHMYADWDTHALVVHGSEGWKKYGSGCQTKRSTLLCIALGFVVLSVASFWIFWGPKQKKVVKLRRNLFIRNGGKLLEAKHSIQKTLPFFTAEDLKKATDNYDENNVLSQEHHLGITYKGILPGMNRIVTVQFCYAFDRCKIEVLVSKLAALSQINHRNVVKLLGCCLETQVPLLVYESITVRNLLDYITDDCLARSLSWGIRLRIAADSAGALAYMHSATSVPIIHGSLDSSRILLGHDYAVKVHGLALTCSECSCVQFYGGISGCLDPDYFLSGLLTEKSDVYSFGFILAELLTGKDVMSPEWLEGEENLAKYFGASSRGDDLLGIFDDRVVTDDYLGQLTEVAEIAKVCLSSSSQERPTMKEVATALECIIIRDSRLSTRTRATRQLLQDSSDQGGP